MTWEAILPRRGRHRLGGLRAHHALPFGIFPKAARPTPREEVIVFPALSPPPTHLLRQGAGRLRGRAAAGSGQRLHDIRDYRAGDDPRLVHWKSAPRRAR